LAAQGGGAKIEEFERSGNREAEEVDDRRHARDLAMDSSPQGEFTRWFGINAARIERF
jgi:hypothetical protein